MSIANIDVGAAENWSNRLKQEIDEIAPIINQVDNIWNEGPNEGTITGAIAEKVSQLDESWIRAIDTAYDGINTIIGVITRISNIIEESVEKVRHMF